MQLEPKFHQFEFIKMSRTQTLLSRLDTTPSTSRIPIVSRTRSTVDPRGRHVEGTVGLAFELRCTSFAQSQDEEIWPLFYIALKLTGLANSASSCYLTITSGVPAFRNNLLRHCLHS